MLSETGSLEKRPLNRTAPIYESEKLNAYIEENPNALLKEVAAHFEGSVTGAFYALEREKITLKKKRYIIRKGTKKNEQSTIKS